jgi:ribosome biogenesis GTPase
LDDQETNRSTGAGKPKKKTSKSAPLDPSEANATVTEVFPNQCRVRPDPDAAAQIEQQEILCSYRRAQILQSPDEVLRERSPVAVGDRVQIEMLNPQAGVVEGLVIRRNFLARPAPGKEDPNIIHVIAANIDLLVIVASVTLPDFSPGLIDRYLIASQAAGIPALICVTKADLANSETARLWEAYGELGYQWILTGRDQENALPGENLLQHGLESLKNQVAGKTVVFCGHSGVGKTSLFRTLLNRDIGRIGEVNVQTGKGRHTTTSSILYRDEATQANWIDTPGIREFGLIGVEAENLRNFFPEFSSLACTANGCSHLGEEGCEATDLFRHGSYLRIHESLLERDQQLASK